MNTINAALIFGLVVSAYVGAQVGLVFVALVHIGKPTSENMGIVLQKVLAVIVCFLIGMQTIQAFSVVTRWVLTFAGLRDTGPHSIMVMIIGMPSGFLIATYIGYLFFKRKDSSKKIIAD